MEHEDNIELIKKKFSPSRYKFLLILLVTGKTSFFVYSIARSRSSYIFYSVQTDKTKRFENLKDLLKDFIFLERSLLYLFLDLSTAIIPMFYKDKNSKKDINVVISTLTK